MIPAHMSKCPRHGGLPVPLVVATTKGRIELARSEWPQADLQTVWTPSNDVPDFGKYDEEKCRRCIAERRCHVCWEQLPHLLLCVPGLRNPNASQRIEIDGRSAPMVKQPWVCAPCLAFACVNCPPLRARIDAGDGLVCVPHKTLLINTFYQPCRPGDPVPPKGATVLLCLKIAVLRGTWTPLPAWSKRIAR